MCTLRDSTRPEENSGGWLAVRILGFAVWQANIVQRPASLGLYRPVKCTCIRRSWVIHSVYINIVYCILYTVYIWLAFVGTVGPVGQRSLPIWTYKLYADLNQQPRWEVVAMSKKPWWISPEVWQDASTPQMSGVPGVGAKDTPKSLISWCLFALPQFPRRFMTGRGWFCWCYGLLLCLRLLYLRGVPELVWLQIWEFCVYHHCCFKTTLLGGFKQICLMYLNVLLYYDVLCICVFCCSHFHPDVGKIGE